MISQNTPANALLQWSEHDEPQEALWRSERGNAAPKRVQVVDDTLSADEAYRLAAAGVGMLWRGDFQNAKLLMLAIERRLIRHAERRIDKHAQGKAKPRKSAKAIEQAEPAEKLSPQEAMAKQFYKHRQAQAQRARMLGMVLLPFDADYGIPLPRAPDARLACTEAWGPAGNTKSVTSLRELLGVISAHEWRKRGVVVPALGRDKKAVERRIHAHYGVFAPVRGEYIDLVEQAPLPSAKEAGQLLAFDIGTGSGVLSAVLAMRGVGQIVATDLDARALVCAKENLTRLVGGRQLKLEEANLFPDVAKHGKAQLIVCNPPWLPGTPGSALERAVYDPGSQMLRGFLQGLPSHLDAKGEAWLILSDLAEHLGLRRPDELAGMIEAAGLKVLGKLHTQPRHPKANDAADPFYAARSRETTHLWRLVVK
jgi:methylase of polypeptide subunit release factors